MKLSKKVVLVTTAVLGELVVGGGLAVGSMNQAANATTKYPQLDNPNWQKDLNKLKGHRYSNLKGEGLIDYGSSQYGKDAYANDTLFFNAVEQPYSQVGKAAHDTSANIKNSHELYSQIRGRYFSYIVNKGKSVTMKNVNQAYKAYNGKKNQFYRQNGKNFLYVTKKPIYLFTSPNFTKGTMKYKVPAGSMYGTSQVQHVKGNYSMRVINPVMPYENMYATTNKKYVYRFNGMNSYTNHYNKDLKFRNWSNQASARTNQKIRHFMQLK